MAVAVDRDVAFATLDPLARVVAALPPFRAVLALCESMMAAVGVASRPCLRRLCRTSSALIRSHNPLSRQARNCWWQLSQGGKLIGSARHWQPVRATYRMASSTRRTGYFRGLPPTCRPRRSSASAASRTGSNIAHCAFVRSLGYIPQALTNNSNLGSI